MFLSFFLLLIFSFSILCYFIKIPSYRTYKLAQKLPGWNTFSILGIAFELAQQDMTTILPYVVNKAKPYTKVARMWFLGVPVVIIIHPDIIKEILGNDRNLKKGWEYEYFKNWMGSLSIFTSMGGDWKLRRQIINTPLNSRLIEKLGCINKYAKRMVEKILDDNENETDVLSNTSICSLNSSCEALMGVEIDQESEEGRKYVQSLKYVLKSICYRVVNGIYMKDWMFKLTPLGRYFNYYKDINFEFTKKTIISRIEIRNKSVSDINKSTTEEIADADLGIKTDRPIIDSILEHGTVYRTEDEIVKEINGLIFAAHDTTAVTLMFVIFCLANNKDIQEKVFKEQESIFETSKRDVTYQDVKRMTYLSQVIKESMRLYPTVPYLSRELQQDVKYDDLLIPKGCNAMIMPMAIHHNPQFYPEPEKFDPERFSPEECRKRHLYSYIPFSAGPRICPGLKYAEMALKVFLSTLIRNFELHPVTKPEDLVLKMSIVLLPEKPLKVKFISRNKNSINY